MSLSLSSLLNPSPDADPSPPPPSQTASTTRKDSLPPIQHVKSPDQQFTSSPQSVDGPHHRSIDSHPPPADQDAVQTLAFLSETSNHPHSQSQWAFHQRISEQGYESLRGGSSHEHRPGSSGYGEPIQLPPPPPPQARQNSSPTLDQYHVASRSPEQRRASLISPEQSTFTLPPIQSINSTQQSDHSARPPSNHGQASIYDDPHLPVSRVGGASGERSQEQPTIQEPHQTQPPPKTSNMSEGPEEMESSPAIIKQEAHGTPAPSSPAPPIDQDSQTLKPFISSKSEQTLSPLRDSSVPVPSTETSAPEPAPSKKRPAPAKTKKGTATATKKAPPAKKRKVDPSKSKPIDRSLTPLKALSSKGATPATSSPAPSTRSASADADEDAYDEDEDMDSGDAGSSDDVYCICRRPDTGTFMIGCDGTCDDWFHGKCVGIEERDKNLIDKYMCPNCTKAGVGQTTWKRICRRPGCRFAARVSKSSKTGREGGGSKFCSDDCGVTFFRDMVGKTRGREEMAKNRHTRRKGDVGGLEQSRDEGEDDLGARGGRLAAGELKALVNASKNADDFKKLGEGVLSPPATPDSKASPTAAPKDPIAFTFTDPETQSLQEIQQFKDDARHKHALLKDRMKFITLVKQAATAAAAEKDLKPKDFCGYDSRIEWTDTQFAAWRATPSGKQALELDTLTPADGNGDTAMEDGEFEYEVCERKKCARHLEWAKLAVDSLRFEMGENSDRMRGLDREEKEIRERAALRSKAGRLAGEGWVEVRGLGEGG